MLKYRSPVLAEGRLRFWAELISHTGGGVSVEGRLGTSLSRGHFTHLGVAASLHTCYDVVHENKRVFFSLYEFSRAFYIGQ